MTTSSIQSSTTAPINSKIGIGGVVYNSGGYNGVTTVGGNTVGGNIVWQTSAATLSGWQTLSTSPTTTAASFINACKGDDFSMSGPLWVRDDISLSADVPHFKRWIQIVGANDYGCVPTLDVFGVITVHPAFCSLETFSAFGEWWDIYHARFEELPSSLYPTMPCGEISSVFVVKSVSPEYEFCQIYPLLVADIWFEKNKWIFTDQRDAVMAKMLFAK